MPIERIKTADGTERPVSPAFRESIEGEPMDYTLNAISANTPRGTLVIDTSSAGGGVQTLDLYMVSGARTSFSEDECMYMSGHSFTGAISKSGVSLSFSDQNLYSYDGVSLSTLLSAFIYMSSSQQAAIVDDDTTSYPFANTFVCHMNAGFSGMILAMTAGTYTAGIYIDAGGPTQIGTVTLTLPAGQDGIYICYAMADSGAGSVTLDAGAVLTIAEYFLDERYIGSKIPTICVGPEYYSTADHVNFNISVGLRNIQNCLTSAIGRPIQFIWFIVGSDETLGTPVLIKHSEISMYAQYWPDAGDLNGSWTLFSGSRLRHMIFMPSGGQLTWSYISLQS